MTKSIPENALSQYDLGRIKTSIGFYETLFRLHDLKMEHCVPAIVREYDRKTGKVKVQPLIFNISDTPNGEVEFSRPEYEVQVRNICHGGFEINIPLFVGDTGWLISCDRNATTAKEKNSKVILKDQPAKDGDNEGEQRPDDASTGGFEFGFFLPDYFGDHEVHESDGMVVKYTPPDDHSGVPVKINLSKTGLSIEKPDVDGIGIKIEMTGSEVSIVRAGENTDTIKLSDKGLVYEGVPDREESSLVDLRYDMASHCIQKKIRTDKIRGDFVVGVGRASKWMTIEGGQAVPEQVSEN